MYNAVNQLTRKRKVNLSKWGVGVSHVASQQEGPVRFLNRLEFLCPWFHVGSLQVLHLPPTV